jgi:hypothetical protein
VVYGLEDGYGSYEVLGSEVTHAIPARRYSQVAVGSDAGLSVLGVRSMGEGKSSVGATSGASGFGLLRGLNQKALRSRSAVSLGMASCCGAAVRSGEDRARGSSARSGSRKNGRAASIVGVNPRGSFNSYSVCLMLCQGT